MTQGRWLRGIAIAVGTMACASAPLVAQVPQAPQRPAARPGRDQLPQPVYRVAQQLQEPATVAANTNTPGGGFVPSPQQDAAPLQQQEHPLVPALQRAYSAMNHIRADIKDYSCTMIKRERIDGKLNEPEFMHVRIRHEPFSVYMYFLGPERLRGQEALYVANKNNGNLMGHAGSGLRKVAGTVSLPPTGILAMAGQRYPITEIGFANLTKRLIEVAEHDKNFGECEVKFYQGAKINKRSATCIQVVHPVPRKEFKFNKALVFVDDELNIPVRYEAYDWPDRPGGPPLLLEEYTYTDVKINNGYTDADFDDKNPQYHFH